MDAIGFVRRPMVRWFDPDQLVDTVARVIMSGVWSSYVDSRELQSLAPGEFYDRSAGDELWFDYVSDLGDGWNSTYTVARLLAAEELEVPGSGPTCRGRILVMGGDQVYPVPKRSEYENRMIGPYRSALPCAPGGGPELFAIPGSHDWYDGLINFTNIFCRGRSIGGWRTNQTRSYFAVKLPHRWWLWGIDMQFGNYLDEVQLRYFAEIAAKEMQPGDAVIICMAKEVESGRASEEVSSDRDLEHLEREIIHSAGGRVLLYLKSGRHHYVRYQNDERGAQLVTAGGGGAFMHPTHGLPAANNPYGKGERSFRREAVYPSEANSKRLLKRVFLLPAYNLPLAGVFGALQVLLAFMLGLHLGHRHLGLSSTDLARALWDSPTAAVLLLAVIFTFAVMVRAAHDATGTARFVIGFIHSLMLFATVTVVMITASRLSAAFGRGAGSLLIFLLLLAIFGGVGGVLGTSAYLWATNRLGYHGNEAYAPLHHADYKNFLRLKLAADGTLTIYPIGVDRVGRRWELRPDDPAEAPWFAPVGDEPAAHLIEGPLRIAR